MFVRKILYCFSFWKENFDVGFKHDIRVVLLLLLCFCLCCIAPPPQKAPDRVTKCSLRGGVRQRMIQKTLRRGTPRCWSSMLGTGRLGHWPGARPGKEALQWASGGYVLAHGARLGAAEEITWNYLQAVLPPAGKGIRIGCIASQLAGNGRKPSMLTPGRADWFQGCGT